MTTKQLNWAARVWASVNEPRRVTMTAVMAYAVAVAASVGVVADPTPHPIPGTDAAFIALAAALLGVGGLVGIPTAWAGRWWIERVAAMACLGGSVLFLFEALTLYAPGGPDLTAPSLTVTSAGWGVALFTSRLFRVSRRPYAAGKGPSLPEDTSDQLVAVMLVREATQNEDK